MKPLTRRVEPIDEDIINFRNWASVKRSVKRSLGLRLIGFSKESVCTSVMDSLKKYNCDWEDAWRRIQNYDTDYEELVWNAVFSSLKLPVIAFSEKMKMIVGDAILDFCAAYVGSFFPEIKKWKYVKHKIGEYPYEPAVKLWNRGFFASLDGMTWRLHSGRKARIVYEFADDKIDDYLVKM